MIQFFYALAGIVAGTLINWASDYLPRFAAHRKIIAQPMFEFALGRVLTTRSLANWMRATVEGITAMFFVYLSWRANDWASFLAPASAFIFFTLVALIDFKYRLVLNVLVYPAAVILVSLGLFAPGARPLAMILGGLFGFTIFALTAFLRPNQIGAGDVKLATLIGLALGFPNVLWALLIGVGAGGAAAIVLLKRPGWNLSSQMPYAPFLSLGAIIAFVYNPFAAFIR